jgi:phage gp29-like protein
MVTLYDQYGQPASSKRLAREQAVGSIGSVRSPYESLVAPGLTPRKLQHLIARATDGDHADYLQLAVEMEKRDPNYFMALQTRKLAVQELDVKVESSSEDGEDTKVAGAVEDVLNSFAFNAAVLDILDATSKGFSVTEIIWKRSEEIWMPVGYKHRPQRWFFFERDQLEELRLENGSADGELLEPFKYIEHRPHVFSGVPLAGGLARIVAAYHVFKGLAVKSWMAFCEVFGMPMRVGTYTQGASDADKVALAEAVTRIGTDAAAIISETMKIEFLRANASGNAGSDDFFRVLSGWLNREVNTAVLGSNLVDEDGGSFAKAKVLDTLRSDLLKSDAKQLASTVQRCLVRAFVDLNFGARRKATDYPLVGFDTEEPEDLELLAKSLVPFVNLGLPVPIAWVAEKFGITLPEKGEPILKAPAAEAPSEEGEDEGDEPDPESADAEESDDEEPAAKARARASKAAALVARVEELAGRSTNMRSFRRQLNALLERHT